ncbi:MAG TPA: response regulator transcription factor [Bacteriovoracaceae bacterium]|nr:response regulator transcription factor [Bacteriovoracaceae bacterium]
MIIEDEEQIISTLRYLLEKKEYEVTSCLSAEEFFAEGTPKAHCLYLVDWNLPGIKGVDVIKAVRTKDKISPIFMMSAYDKPEQILEGLSSGADDYLTKPFSYDELLLKIHNAFSKIECLKDNMMNVGIKLIPEAHTVIKDGAIVNLTAREYIIFQHLYKNQEKASNREELIRQFDKDLEMTSRNIDVHIFSLRKKMSKLGITIETVWGTGYKLNL